MDNSSVTVRICYNSCCETGSNARCASLLLGDAMGFKRCS